MTNRVQNGNGHGLVPSQPGNQLPAVQQPQVPMIQPPSIPMLQPPMFDASQTPQIVNAFAAVAQCHMGLIQSFKDTNVGVQAKIIIDIEEWED